MQVLGFLLVLIGFITVTATVRVQMFREGTGKGLLSFVIPFYCWWYSFSRFTHQSKALILSVVIVCYIVGGGAFVYSAVNDFDQYRRKAIGTEAIDMLTQISKGASEYFSQPRVSSDDFGRRLPCQFPVSQAVSPAATCCGQVDDECKRDDSAWLSPTWAALRFQMPGPHRFRYSFESNGKTGSEAEATISALGDLDCDGAFSTFQLFIRGEEHYGDCSISIGPWFTENEGE